MNIVIQKVSLTPQTEETLIAMSVQWEQENNCCGFQANTAEDLKRNK